MFDEDFGEYESLINEVPELPHPEDVEYGEVCECPVCGCPCIKIVDPEVMNEAVGDIDNFCFYNNKTESWECSECWLK